MSLRNISTQSCHNCMVTIFAKQQLCLRSHVTFSLELKTYNTWYVFKGLEYKMSNYSVCNLFIYNKIYIYTHTCKRIRHEDRLRKNVWEGKGRHCLWPPSQSYIYTGSGIMPELYTKLSSTQYFFPELPECSHLGRCWSNSLGPRAAFDNRVYKNATSPVCPQVGVSPLVIWMHFFFFLKGLQEEDQKRRASGQASLKSLLL